MIYIVISYDIPDDRRRNRVAKLLKGFGARVQYSVFEAYLSPGKFSELKSRLKVEMEPQEDSILFYSLCENCLGKKERWGVKPQEILDEESLIF